MCRHAMAIRSAAKFFDSPSGVSRPGTWIGEDLLGVAHPVDLVTLRRAPEDDVEHALPG